MNKKMEYLLSLILGFCGYLLGNWDIFLKALLIMMILDYFTGLLKAGISKTLSGKVGLEGILKKIVIFVVITAANIIQQLLNNTIPLRETIIIFYIFNETLSLFENAGYFIPIPKYLKDAILELKNKDKYL